MKPLILLWLTVLSYTARSEDIPDRIARIFQNAHIKHHFSGVLLVAEKGKPIYYSAKGIRDLRTGVALQKTDIFELASVSKQFTAMIIMMLKEQGKLKFDDHADKYLNIKYRNVTIRQLLNHTSGLPDYQEIMDRYWDKSKVAGNEDAIQYLNKYGGAMHFPSGSDYEYSNTGYILLASIAEKVSGKDFVELCRNWIFVPLQMKDTDIRTNEKKKATEKFALGHVYVKELHKYARADSFPSSDYTIWLGNRKGPGRISSTAEDLLKWDRALYSNKLVSQKTLNEALSVSTLSDGLPCDYGFGWMIDQNPKLGKVVYHSGDNPGYHTYFVRFIDKDYTIILLNNNDSEEMINIIGSITEALINK
jgi:CubicO group peptidase (beta-lactamase class C family)